MENIKSSSLSGIENKTFFDEKDVQTLTKGVACFLHTELVESIKNKKSVEKGTILYTFSEENYFNELTSLETIGRLGTTPAPQDIEIFVTSLMEALVFSPGCIVISQIYMNRLLGNCEMPVLNHTWRPLILITLLLAQKMWDENFKTNTDFSIVYPFFTTEELNQMEMNLLELIKYNTNVKFSQFVQFYLTIKELVVGNDTPVENYVNLELKEKLKLQSKKFSAIVKNKANTISV
jgi:hypothetical protein